MELSSGPPILPRNDACLNVTKRRTRARPAARLDFAGFKGVQAAIQGKRLQDGFTLTSYCAVAAMHP
jgi:hypothetical protein